MTSCLVPQWNSALCDGCGLCAEACPCQAVTFQDGIPVFACGQKCQGVAQTRVCGGWAICEDVCPTHALQCGFSVEG
ncbi:MAG: 4Fe-4S binding protein [Anaerolineae bacterium]